MIGKNIELIFICTVIEYELFVIEFVIEYHIIKLDIVYVLYYEIMHTFHLFVEPHSCIIIDTTIEFLCSGAMTCFIQFIFCFLLNENPIHWRSIIYQFLDASTHLYKRVGPSVRRSVRRSVMRFFQ